MKYSFKAFALALVMIAPVTSVFTQTNYKSNLYIKSDDALYKAIVAKNALEATALIEMGFDMNKTFEKGTTYLMLASYYGLTPIIERLLEAGMDVNIFDDNGDTALNYALSDPKASVERVTLLLKAGAKFKYLNNSEHSPLVLATIANNKDCVSLLLDAGAKVDQRGKLGMTPLIYACENKAHAAAKELIKRGADLEKDDYTGFNPLVCAAFNNDAQMLRILIAAGANIEFKTKKSIEIEEKSKNIFEIRIYPKYITIPKGSTAFDVAKQFQKQAAINVFAEELD